MMDFFWDLSLREKILLSLLALGLFFCFVFSFFLGGIIFGALFSFFYTNKVLSVISQVKDNFMRLSWLEQLVLGVAGVYFLCLTYGFFLGILAGLGLKRIVC